MDLSLTEWISCLVVGSLLIIGMLSAFSRGRRMLREREARSRRVICRLCLHAFEHAGHHADGIECPRCKASNQLGRRNGAI